MWHDDSTAAAAAAMSPLVLDGPPLAGPGAPWAKADGELLVVRLHNSVCMRSSRVQLIQRTFAA
jgi:hypothetical protein